MTTAQAVLLGMLALLLAIAAIGDARTRIIPNRLNLAVAVLAGGWWWACDYGWAEIGIHIGCALAVLILFGACFAIGMMGGGDVKLLVALALWLPGDQLLRMLMFMAVGGGILTLVMLALHALRRAEGRPEIPYGLAIAGATLLVVANDILTTPTA